MSFGNRVCVQHSSYISKFQDNLEYILKMLTAENTLARDAFVGIRRH